MRPTWLWPGYFFDSTGMIFLTQKIWDFQGKFSKPKPRMADLTLPEQQKFDPAWVKNFWPRDPSLFGSKGRFEVRQRPAYSWWHTGKKGNNLDLTFSKFKIGKKGLVIYIFENQKGSEKSPFFYWPNSIMNYFGCLKIYRVSFPQETLLLFVKVFLVGNKKTFAFLPWLQAFQRVPNLVRKETLILRKSYWHTLTFCVFIWTYNMYLLFTVSCRDGPWPDPTRAYFWPAVNKRPTHLWRVC